jgi:beta-glucosidase-like glycosyl hydrolase
MCLQTTPLTACRVAPTTGCSTPSPARSGKLKLKLKVVSAAAAAAAAAVFTRITTCLCRGFDGYITSDCDADNDVVFSHHYANHTPAQGVADVMHAGTDVDCGGFVGKYAQAALDAKTITEADMDERLNMLFKVRLRLSHFDPVGPLQSIGQDQICSDENKATSMEGMIQSATLLKNEKGALPLSGTASAHAIFHPSATVGMRL